MGRLPEGGASRSSILIYDRKPFLNSENRPRVQGLRLISTSFVLCLPSAYALLTRNYFLEILRLEDRWGLGGRTALAGRPRRSLRAKVYSELSQPRRDSSSFQTGRSAGGSARPA